MKVQRAHVVKLYPDAGQEEFLRQIGGATRFLWNLALYQRQIWGKRHGLNRFTDMLTGLKADGSGLSLHQAALPRLPASTGRLMRCPSTGFNGLSARRRMFFAALMSAFSICPQAVQTKRA